jgi:hypothetical protein
MNYKRHKPRRYIRCDMCTPHRQGNGTGKAYWSGNPKSAPYSKRCRNAEGKCYIGNVEKDKGTALTD